MRFEADRKIKSAEQGAYTETRIVSCDSLLSPIPGVSQGPEEGIGPLGHTRRFGQFWTVTMTDPPQTGSWEMQVAAEGTPRVRVQGKERRFLGRGVVTMGTMVLSVSDSPLPSPDFPGLPLSLRDSCGGRTPPWPLPPDSASCR